MLSIGIVRGTPSLPLVTHSGVNGCGVNTPSLLHGREAVLCNSYFDRPVRYKRVSIQQPYFARGSGSS